MARLGAVVFWPMFCQMCSCICWVCSSVLCEFLMCMSVQHHFGWFQHHLGVFNIFGRTHSAAPPSATLLPPLDLPFPGPTSPGPPKMLLFPSLTPFSLSVFLSLGRGLLVESWSRVAAMDHPNCAFGLPGVILCEGPLPFGLTLQGSHFVVWIPHSSTHRAPTFLLGLRPPPFCANPSPLPLPFEAPESHHTKLV